MIIWAKQTAGEVFEIQSSFRFCRKTTERLTGERFIDIDTEMPLDVLLNLFSQEEDILFVNDPETIIPRLSLDLMKKNLSQKNALAAGPVMNTTSYSGQRADLPFRYLDLATFQETAGTLAQNHGERSQLEKELDPACFLVSSRLLRSIPPETKISQVVEYLDRDLHVSKGALIHRFSGYFSSDRTDLTRLVPQHARKVLDIGCAKGGYGRTLKKERSDIFLVGIELYPELAEEAQRCYDQVITGTIGDIELPDDFDVVNLGDVLEHLQDPWGNLAKLYVLLKPNGFLVGSVPNIGHWTIVRNLLEGDFQYIPFGLLCIGHLRFFTEKTLITSLEDAGFMMDLLEREQIAPTPMGANFIAEMTESGWGDETSLMTNEFIFRAQKVSR